MPNAIEAKRQLDKEAQVILTAQFAERVNVLIGKMPDNQHFASLAIPWGGHFNPEDYKLRTAPTQEWKDFMESISEQEKIQLCKNIYIINNAFNRQISLGIVRQWAKKGANAFRLGPRGSSFATLAYQKIEEPTQQLAEQIELNLV
jgi:hypothetical protein